MANNNTHNEKSSITNPSNVTTTTWTRNGNK
jgi:hypothetical protein